MAIVDELIAILGYDVRGEGELDRFNQGMDRAAKNAQVAANRINAVSVAVGSFLGAAAFQAVQRLGSVIGSFPGDVLATSAQFEGFETALTTIEGSAEKARSSMDWIQDFATRTPYELAGVTDAFIKLKSYGIDPLDGSLTTLGDAASAMNKPLNQAVEMFADAATFQFERLREFGIVANQKGNEVTFQWTRNGETLTKTIKKNGNEVRKFLLENLGSRFNGAMLRQSKTWNGMMSNLGDSWENFKLRIGRAGFFDMAKRRLGDLLDTVGELADNGMLDRIAGGISSALDTAASTAIHLARNVWDVGKGAFYAADALVELVSRVTGLNKAVSASILGAGLLGTSATGRAMLLGLAKRIPMISALLLADDLLTGLRGGDSYIAKLEGGTAAFQRVQESVGSLRTAWADLGSTIEGVFKIEMPNTGIFSGEFLANELTRFVRELGETIEDIAAALKTLDEALKDPEAAWERFVSAIIAQMDRLLTAIDEKTNGLLTKLGVFGEELPTVEVTAGEELPQEPREGKKSVLARSVDYVARAWNRIRGRGDAEPLLPDEERVASGKTSRIPVRPHPQSGMILDGLDAAKNAVADAVTSTVEGIKQAALTAAEEHARQNGSVIAPKGDRLGADSTTPSQDRFAAADVPVAPQASGMEELKAMLSNVNGRLADMTGTALVDKVSVTDARQDNRSFPISTTVNVGGVNVQQAAQAPAAVGAAVGNAAATAVNTQASRIAAEPASAP